MNDARYVYKQDLREKKSTARSAHNKRSHAGKGGAVKFPSDYLSRKERNAMNGEVKVYRLNEPMKWKEFKAMPENHQVAYITALRQKFGVTDMKLAEMFGVSQNSVCLALKSLGLSKGKEGNRKKWDVDGWTAWLNGLPAHAAEEDAPEAVEPEAEAEEQWEDICEDICETSKERVVPCSGSMTFDGSVDAALNTLRLLLGGATARITVAWSTDTGVIGGG